MLQIRNNVASPVNQIEDQSSDRFDIGIGISIFEMPCCTGSQRDVDL